MHHLKGWKLTGRDRSRRLGYQERQRLQAKEEQAKGQIKVFVKKLVK